MRRGGRADEELPGGLVGGPVDETGPEAEEAPRPVAEGGGGTDADTGAAPWSAQRDAGEVDDDAPDAGAASRAPADPPAEDEPEADDDAAAGPDDTDADDDADAGGPRSDAEGAEDEPRRAARRMAAGDEPDADAQQPEPDSEGLAGLVPARQADAAADEPVPDPTAGDAGDPHPTAPEAPAARDVPAARRPADARRSRPPSSPSLDFGPDAGPDPLAEGRPAALRMARLHLRAGQHALARAELEALAGRGRLDEEALLDLAEVRWRTGDLSGAGDAANVLLARGSEPPLALAIAAEAVSAAGRPGEARRLSARALEAADGPLDPLFAGMPRALVWPAPAPAAAGAPPAPSGRRGRRAPGEAEGAPSTAAEAFAGGRAALARGDTNRAALLLGVAIRLEPGFAEDVLRAVAGRDDQPLLALVRGDALRLLGREADALDAFQRARGRSTAAATRSPEPGGPGLFDQDPAISDHDRA